MEIYGLGILGGCMYAGFFIGKLLAQALGLSGDVGGVGFAMILMIVVDTVLKKKGKPLSEKTAGGIKFMSGLYIPVVVAMSMNQNVYAAVTQGLVPIVSGILATVLSLLLIPFLSKLGKTDDAKTGEVK